MDGSIETTVDSFVGLSPFFKKIIGEIFDGKQNKFRLVEAKTAIEANDQETEISRRNIIDEVIESESGLRACQKKVDQSALQLRQASQAYDLAKARFDAGVITNLELLDGSTQLFQRVGLCC